MPASFPELRECRPGTRVLPIFLCLILRAQQESLMGLVPLQATALPQPWVSAFQIRHQVLPHEPPLPAITLFFQLSHSVFPHPV